MIDQYARTELLIGEDGLKRLKDSSVMVFGVGGVGSHCIEALARSGVGRLILVDNDAVSVTNINRQSIAYHSTIGRMKTEVMRERIRDIDPAITVRTYETFVLPDNLADLLDQAEKSTEGKIDYIIDAIDTVSAKIALVEASLKRGIRLISSMGTGNKLHPELFETAPVRVQIETEGRLTRGMTIVDSVDNPQTANVTLLKSCRDPAAYNRYLAKNLVLLNQQLFPEA